MILFASFETEFTSHGGLGAVMKQLPGEIGASACAVIAPRFKHLLTTDMLSRHPGVEKASPLFSFSILVRGIAHPIEIMEVVNRNGIRHFLLSSPEFFNARRNPYENPSDPFMPPDPYRNPINGEKLTEDALFFSIATPVALAELVKSGHLADRDVILHLQDWETAAVAKAVRRTRTQPAVRSIRCVLTIHNPYDKPLHAQNSQRVCDLAAHLDLKLNRSILEQTIPLLDAPVSTVSTGFAHELRNEALYTQVFCPHLQSTFRKRGLIGIDNGIFGAADFPFSETTREHAGRGDLVPLQSEKRARREQLGAALHAVMKGPSRLPSQQAWGDLSDLDDPAVPVFFLPGRDDPRQKGFDLMAEAIRRQPRGTGRYIFSVMPGDEGLPGMEFLRRLSIEREGEVVVFPFRMDKTSFDQIRQGCSFLVMGSLYEPFGAANEGYLSGMPVVARATGGLIQQVAPDPACMENEKLLSLYGRKLARQYHGDGDAPTGILYRESVTFADEVEGWRELVNCGYWNQNPKGDRLEDRASILLFRTMTESAATALELAMRIYADQPRYAAMIYNGWNMLSKFQWQSAVSAYQRHLYLT